MKLTLEVSEDNECTSFPWWVIVDPQPDYGRRILMGRDEERIHTAAAMVTGPFFSREEAEDELKATRYNYSKRAVVYCKSGCYSRQYQWKMREASKHWADKPVLRQLFWFLTLPFSLKQYLKKKEENNAHR